MRGKPDYIVFFAACPFPFGSASDNAIYTFMSGFNEHGCDGEVVCLYPRLPRHYSSVAPVGEYNGIRYRYLHNKVYSSRSKIINRIDNKYLVYYLFKRYLKALCKHHRVVALFEAQVDNKYYKLSKICKSLGVKVILRGCEYPEYLNFKEDTPVRREQFRELVSFTDMFIFETKTLEDYYKEILRKPIISIVIPATMPFEDILACKRTSCEHYIAYCGSIYSDTKDGLSNIIKAFSLFRKEHSETKLKLIGRIVRDDYYNDLLTLVEKLRLSDSVIFTGEVSREEYVQYLTNAELMMVAKPTGSYYSGGLSSKVMEYLFSGNPVVMVAADDYVNYLTDGENVIFAKDNNPETLYEALQRLFANDTIRKSIGENGKVYAMLHFNFHKLTETLLPFVLS